MRDRPDPELLLRECHAAAIAAVLPARAMAGPLAALKPGDAPCWIIAAGKAAHGMAAAIVGWLAEQGRAPAGGIVIGADTSPAPHPGLLAMVGNHPLPGVASAHAARAIADLIAVVPASAEVHVAISGGASSLLAGPLDTLSFDDVHRTFELLLTSGLDIREMNAVRKRVTRWSAGRLGLALAPRRVHLWVISDVIGDDPADIGSGPCTGDDWSSGEVAALLERHDLGVQLPVNVQRSLLLETPRRDHPALAAIEPRIVATNRIALEAAWQAALARGVAAEVVSRPIQGEAADVGRELGRAAMDVHRASPMIRILGGETTVTIRGPSGAGGRAQEQALAAAEVMQRGPCVLLAAGTDGRDGMTDAAGAIVSGATWDRAVLADRDPLADLAQHDSYASLNAAGALIRTGPTGTNVMDVVLVATGWR